MPITDPDDQRLDDYRHLKQPAARRRIEGDELFVAEGPTAIERLIESPHRIRSVLVSHAKLARLAPILASCDAPIYVVTAELFERIVGFDLHRGAIAAAERRSLVTIDEITASSSLVVVLEGLNDPENLGAIARSARAFGVDALVLDPTCIDPYTRRTVRTSMGELLLMRWHRAAPADWPATTLQRLRSGGYEIWAMTPGGSDDAWNLARPDRLAVVLGAEGPGLSARTMATADRQVRLPIAPGVDSLNVGAAAAVTLSIATRPRP